MASTYLTRTISTASNRRTWTWSAWIKRSDITTGYQTLFSSDVDSNNMTRILFWGTQQLTVSSKIGGSFPIDYRLTRTFRDTSAWYHIVVAMDTTQATDTNRLKIYINGVLETAYEGSSASLPSLDEDTWINSTNPQIIGKSQTYDGLYGGSMSHIHFIDGTAYDATAFGETDATTGEWEAKTSPSVTYGTNGFFILKDGNGITDQSGEGNDFTLGGGTLTDLKDNPDNVFATLNPNYQSTFATSRATLANGNTKWTGSSNNTSQNAILSTLGASSGKWYLEAKWVGTQDSQLVVAKSDFGMMTAGSGGFQSAGWYGMITNISNTGGSGMAWWSNNSATGDRGNTISTNDIIMMAIDIDNSKLYFGKNGTWEESGDPTSGATGTGATSTLASNTTYLVGCSNYGYDTANSWEFNFGNGYFGTTAITTNSGNGYEGAEGASKFNYTVPTGYSALSTKGLNE